MHASSRNLNESPVNTLTNYVSIASVTDITATTILLLLQPFNGLFSRTTWVSRYQKGKTNLDFTGARDSEWQ